MKRLRSYAVAPVVVAVAAISLTSCSSPSTSFRFVGVDPARSRVFTDEVQVFPGTYTVAADDGADVAALHWSITEGTRSDPGQQPVLSADGVARVSASLAAPPDRTKRVYRICLSSRSQPILQTCQLVAVGGSDLWTGAWQTTAVPVQILATQTGATVDLTFLAPRQPPPPTSGPLRSPFLYEGTIGTTTVTFEWVSATELVSYDAFTTVAQPVRFTPIAP